MAKEKNKIKEHKEEKEQKEINNAYSLKYVFIYCKFV